MTQNQEILRYLKRHGTITPMEALREMGCARLASRIYELRRYGHKIGGYMCKVRTKRGTATVKRYYMVKS